MPSYERYARAGERWRAGIGSIMPAQQICVAGRFCPPIHNSAGAPWLLSFQCPRTGEMGGMHERRFMADSANSPSNFQETSASGKSRPLYSPSRTASMGTRKN
jgi:hypothetical protein